MSHVYGKFLKARYSDPAKTLHHMRISVNGIIRDEMSFGNHTLLTFFVKDNEDKTMVNLTRFLQKELNPDIYETFETAFTVSTEVNVEDENHINEDFGYRCPLNIVDGDSSWVIMDMITDAIYENDHMWVENMSIQIVIYLISKTKKKEQELEI